MDRRALLSSVGAGVVALGSGCVDGLPLTGTVSRSESHEYDVADGTHVGVDSRNGPVTVKGFDGDVIEAEFEVSGPSEEATDAVSLVETRESDVLLLRTDYGDPASEVDVSASLTLRIPDGARVGRIRTANGAVEVTGVAGDATLESRNASVTARDVDGAVSLQTTNGDVTARNIAELRGAETENASVSVDVPALSGATEIRTRNGGVDAALATDLDAELTATTTNGSVDVTGLDLAAREATEGEVSGTLGDGTHEIAVEAENGSIELTALSE